MRTICGIAWVLIIVGLATNAAPAPETRPLGGFESGIWLILRQNDSRIREELKLTENQVKKIEELIAEANQAYSSIRGPDGKIDRQKVRDWLDLNKRHAVTAAKILTKPQLLRAEQIYLQRMSLGVAFRTRQVAAALKLTDEQREKLDLLRKESSQELRGLLPAGGGGQERAQKMAEFRKSRNEKVLNVLTPAQKAKWKQLLGEPFKLELRGSVGGNQSS